MTKYKTMKELASDKGKKHDCRSCRYRLIRTKTIASTIFQFKRSISYNNPSRNQEGQHIDIHKIRGPGRRLVFTDTGNDGDILACISSVRKARMKGQLIQEKQNKHSRTLRCGNISIYTTFLSQRLRIKG